MLIWEKYWALRRKTWLQFGFFPCGWGKTHCISASHWESPGEQGGAAAFSKKSILNLCWWSAQNPHYSRGCIVTDFLIYYCQLYLNTKYLRTWTALVCTLMAPTKPLLRLQTSKDTLRVWINPSSWLPIITDPSVRGESARPVQGQYNYCSMASTSRQSTGESNCISHS